METGIEIVVMEKTEISMAGPSGDKRLRVRCLRSPKSGIGEGAEFDVLATGKGLE